MAGDQVVDVKKRAVIGRPNREAISTSYIERSNLHVRMDCRRFTRLSNGYSKKLDNHEAAQRSRNTATSRRASATKFPSSGQGD